MNEYEHLYETFQDTFDNVRLGEEGLKEEKRKLAIGVAQEHAATLMIEMQKHAKRLCMDVIYSNRDNPTVEDAVNEAFWLAPYYLNPALVVADLGLQSTRLGGKRGEILRKLVQAAQNQLDAEDYLKIMMEESVGAALLKKLTAE